MCGGKDTRDCATWRDSHLHTHAHAHARSNTKRNKQTDKQTKKQTHTPLLLLLSPCLTPPPQNSSAPPCTAVGLHAPLLNTLTITVLFLFSSVLLQSKLCTFFFFTVEFPAAVLDLYVWRHLCMKQPFQPNSVSVGSMSFSSVCHFVHGVCMCAE